MDIVTYALLNGKIKDYASNVDEWLEENVDPTTGYVLDRSLQMENAAAPADMVGDLKNTLNAKTDYAIKLLNSFPFDGFLNTSGAFVSGAQYGSKCSDFIQITGAKIIYNIKMANSIGSICFYKEDKTFIAPAITHNASEFRSGMADIPDNAMYYRVCEWFYSEPNQFAGEVFDYETILSSLDQIKELNGKSSVILENYTDSEFTQGGYIDANGSFVSYSATTTKVTDFIPCHGRPSITYKLMVSSILSTIAFYDENHGFMHDQSVIGEGSLSGGETIENVSIPENAYFFRATMWAPRSDRFAHLDYSMEYISKHLTNDEYKYLYGDSLLRSFDFSGKTAIAFGDSITAGIANEGSGNYDVGVNSYINKFASHVGLSLTNNAVSGSTITFADGETIQSIYTVITNTTTPADVIIIAGGTNDYNTGKPVGTFGDDTEYTCYGALKLICEHLQTNYPDATVIFITPVNITKEFNGHPMELLNLYRNAIFEVATYYGYNVVDGRDMIPVSLATGYDDTMINHNDGCHPTLRGHALYARDLCMKLC